MMVKPNKPTLLAIYRATLKRWEAEGRGNTDMAKVQRRLIARLEAGAA